jgi:acid stress-induced BolA-like protein IbaG/YrbA
MHLSAIAYNLKKYLQFVQKRVKSGTGQHAFVVLVKSAFHYLSRASTKQLKLAFTFLVGMKKAS